MELTSEHPYWTLRDGLLESYPPLTGDKRCDAVIVGGGISGALIAHRLTNKGVDCVLIDQREIGYGSTSASTALLQYEIDTPLRKLRKLVKAAAADRAYLLGVEAIASLGKLAGKDCGFAQRPSLQIAKTKVDLKGLVTECAMRKGIGLSVSLLEKQDLREQGIDGLGAIRSSVAAEVDPYRLAHRLLSLAGKNGLQVFDRTGAIHYEYGKHGATVHTDRKAKLRCKAIVFATGYETQNILPKNIVSIKSTYAFISEPMESFDWWKDRALIWGTDDPYTYMRTTSDRRVLAGGCDDEILNPARRDKQLVTKTARLVNLFNEVFRGVPIEPAFSWAGAFGSTKDGLGYIGRYPSLPNAYFGLGFGGNGITFSTIAAYILSDLFLGRKNPDAKVFCFDR